ncbi:MAG TPA: D-2-hydroxyacid dehydrogenase, partial [Chthoniobacteraceae bacterium]|nr:D-2-hydroxyacid dehydrogenase [Chthoniobacteraceae bacterium]
MTIFCDAKFGESALALLAEGVAPHELVFPQTPAASVLENSQADPAFARADIACGQPDIESIRQSDRLRWIHLTSAGFTRYDTA